MSNTILGTGSAVEQGKRYSWSPTKGISITRTWRMASEATKNSLEAQLRAQMWDINVAELSGGNWEVTATSSTDPFSGPQGEQIVEYWELVPKDCSKELLASHHNLVSGLTQGAVDNIKKAVDNSDTTSATCGLTGNPLVVFKLMRAGVEHVEIEQPILQHVWQVPIGVNLTYSYSYIGRIYTNATLFGEGVPPDLQTSIAAWTASFTNPTMDASRPTCVFGWKKKAPTQRIGSDNKREISQQWEFGFWSTDIYSAAL